MTSCQLKSRHWEIQFGEEESPQVVDGEAVIGMYPTLTVSSPDIEGTGEEDPDLIWDISSEWPFEYQSCTNGWTAPGKMGGWFSFVPGTLSLPNGPEFQVNVAPFALTIPEYIY
eukprot:CAMPEP_0182438610 /NCGR_PEP_ID=MMETSP1167-20130531/85885_1 /TAXON_ID=2988 /ORGANISM="Mallomonas Sp, Strain CCMP3275" /LENGTH=113 /DNA_ID=CAMNT_0024632045 /DNA_START=1344 /DNA_END=1685 /DNA_ORIENTATION=-